MKTPASFLLCGSDKGSQPLVRAKEIKRLEISHGRNIPAGTSTNTCVPRKTPVSTLKRAQRKTRATAV